MKKLTTMLLLFIFLISAASVMTVTTGATVEGDWTASRSADDYNDPDSYRPYSGYKYELDKGLVLVSADYTNNTPYTHLHTKKPYNLQNNSATKNGKSISLEFTVTDFAYEGSDHWIGISLHSKELFTPVKGYGEGVSVLIRGAGNGSAIAQFHYLDDDNGYHLFSEQYVSIPVNEQGQEVYTFEVEYTQEGYKFYLCGQEIVDKTHVADEILNTYCADGAYVGLTFYTTASGTSLGACLSQFQDEVPYGEDSMDPEENRNNFASIIDSDTVPQGKPALIWNAEMEQYTQFQSSNIDLAVNDNGTIKAMALTSSGYIIFSPKVSVSYEASDFPVIAVLTKDCYAEYGKIYYSAGDIFGAQPDCSQDIDIAEYDFGEGWCMGVLDLTGDLDWQGRVNMIRTDFVNVDNTDEEMKYYDIAYIAAFRTIEDAEQYAKDYLVALLGTLPETEDSTTQPPATQAPTTQAPADDSDVPTDSEQATEPNKVGGCGSVLSASALALALLGAAFVIKKRNS